MNFGCYWPHSQLQELPLIGLNQSLYIYIYIIPGVGSWPKLDQSEWSQNLPLRTISSSFPVTGWCGVQPMWRNPAWGLGQHVEGRAVRTITGSLIQLCLSQIRVWTLKLGEPTNSLCLSNCFCLFVFVITCNQGIITEILSPVKLGLTSFLFLAIPCC